MAKGRQPLRLPTNGGGFSPEHLYEYQGARCQP